MQLRRRAGRPPRGAAARGSGGRRRARRRGRGRAGRRPSPRPARRPRGRSPSGTTPPRRAAPGSARAPRRGRGARRGGRAPATSKSSSACPVSGCQRAPPSWTTTCAPSAATRTPVRGALGQLRPEAPQRAPHARAAGRGRARARPRRAGGRRSWNEKRSSRRAPRLGASEPRPREPAHLDHGEVEHPGDVLRAVSPHGAASLPRPSVTRGGGLTSGGGLRARAPRRAARRSASRAFRSPAAASRAPSSAGAPARRRARRRAPAPCAAARLALSASMRSITCACGSGGAPPGSPGPATFRSMASSDALLHRVLVALRVEASEAVCSMSCSASCTSASFTSASSTGTSPGDGPRRRSRAAASRGARRARG